MHCHSITSVLDSLSDYPTFPKQITLEEFSFGVLRDMLVNSFVVTFQSHGKVCSETLNI